ncbi:GNAT family N-acetyltransferase [Flavilitoribacter nigricans]|uniref:GNAT family N-acetyltransferase n=1 Tax=Flavilitoribacter nigricans (strain ATCC 23147 / DSM 23189 / NBRC 102662 / NCIMB 1420 / SS-2) TaxID=1122177 RepID=A0A2D0NG10_FLAN2|nr:GNAT family N-acetyltransferase [Flavilitoribacter nigricans]PHN07442.1 GNAT family N-acetyltransferase [Flavilitoribacter nigricans DSM 23189 = NBRC 102662]
MTIRQATVADYDRIAQLFRNTILNVNIRHYSPEQVKVWSERVKDTPRWLRKITDQYFLLVEDGDELQGMGSITPDGYLDMMYVSHLHQGKGIARMLVEKLEAFARKREVSLIRVDVSLTARPFFERMGFRIVRPQKVEMDGLIFDNFVMEKQL